MKSDERRQAIKRQREQLIQDLEAVYMAAFDRLGELEGEVGEVKAAQLTQMILNSKTAAIHLKRPQPAEQLLVLIQLRRRQANGRLLNRTIRCSVDG